MPQHQLPNAASKHTGYYHPGLSAISHIIQTTPKARVLDLGAPSAASFNFFKAQNCHIRFENLNDFLSSAIKEQLLWDSLAFIKALDNYLDLLHENDHFDVILSWDIFCYLDEGATRYLSKRLAMHCKPTSKIHMVRYWGNVYPALPCEFHMLSADSASNNFESSDKRHFQKLRSLSALQKIMPEFKLLSFSMNEERMHPAFTDAVFSPNCAPLIEAIPASPKPRATISTIAKTTTFTGTRTQPQPTQQALYGYHHSPAIADLFTQKLHSQARLLDLGAYNPHNESLYRRHTPHILFANIPQLIQQPNFGNSQRQPSLFPLRQNWTFDVVMGWDILCRYDHAMINHIMQLLRPHIHPQTVMHLLQYIGEDRAHVLTQCNLLEDQKIELIGGFDGAKHVKHSILDLTYAIGYGKIERSFLFGVGMHENYHEYLVNLAVR